MKTTVKRVYIKPESKIVKMEVEHLLQAAKRSAQAHWPKWTNRRCQAQ